MRRPRIQHGIHPHTQALMKLDELEISIALAANALDAQGFTTAASPATVIFPLAHAELAPAACTTAPISAPEKTVCTRAT